MPIEFKCQSCGKAVRAPDHAGGRRGKCPFCHVSVFIPAPPDPEDDIGLAPVDSSIEARQERLRRESIDYAASVDHAGQPTVNRDAESGAGLASSPGRIDMPKPPATPPADDVNIPDEVVGYVRAMHASKLDAADRIAAKLQRCRAQTNDYVQGLMIDELGISVEGVPPPLVQGFLKTLLKRLD